jgi:DNA-binding NarL/FixJ family response regulator
VPETKKILIAEDHTILREGLKKLLSCHSDFEVVGEARDGLEAVESAAYLKPDLVLLDLSMPRMDGVEAIQEIKKKSPSTKILVLTVHRTVDLIL